MAVAVVGTTGPAGCPRVRTDTAGRPCFGAARRLPFASRGPRYLFHCSSRRGVVAEADRQDDPRGERPRARADRVRAAGPQEMNCSRRYACAVCAVGVSMNVGGPCRPNVFTYRC